MNLGMTVQLSIIVNVMTRKMTITLEDEILTNLDEFALKNGNYEIKIRSKQSPVKSTKIYLDDLHGFSEQLNGSSILFNKNVMIKL